MSRAVSPWILAIRPKTLTAAIVPVVVASACVAGMGYATRPGLAVAALAAALCLQIGTNLFNDVIDYEKGADTAERLGPTRVVQSGLLPARAVARAAVAAFVLAALLALPLVAAGGWPIAVLAVVSLVCGYAYTGGPFPLAYVGLGDLFVILFFGLAAVVGTGFLHIGRVEWPIVVAGLQVGLLAAVLIAINNLRDIEGDARAGKRTLAVRLGKRLARVEIAVLALLPFLLNSYWIARGQLGIVFSFFALPLAVSLVRDVWATEPGRKYNEFLAKAAAVHLLFGINLSVGLWLG